MIEKGKKLRWGKGGKDIDKEKGKKRVPRGTFMEIIRCPRLRLKKFLVFN